VHNDFLPDVTNSLERALAILEAIEQSSAGMTNAEISRKLDIATSTCSYIAVRLERTGYLRRDPENRKYLIGLKTVSLAYGALRQLGFRSMTEPVLYRIAGETGLSAGIGVLQQTHVLLVDRVESPRVVNEAASRSPLRGRSRDERDIGRELPLHSTALGKILLAHLPETQFRRLLSGLSLTRSTPKTIVSKPRLLADLEAVRKRRYAMAEEEQYIGVRALSAPIFDHGGQVRAALSLNGSVADPAWEDVGGLVKLIEIAAREISKRATFT
jgi:IclR family KDG regulon transcriptional repressor